MQAKILEAFLEEYLTAFLADVLMPLHLQDARPLLHTRPEALPSEHPYWKRRRKLVLRYKRQILAAIHNGEVVAGYPDYMRALVGGALEGMLNDFVNGVLGELMLFSIGWEIIFAVSHPYGLAIDDFVYHKSVPLIEMVPSPM